ncbi:hypothetical protein, partial [Candidatus Magnetobacterium casense]
MRAIHRLTNHAPRHIAWLLADLLPAAMEPQVIVTTPTLFDLARQIHEGQSRNQQRFMHAYDRARAGMQVAEQGPAESRHDFPLVLQKLNNDHSGRIMIETMMRTNRSVSSLGHSIEQTAQEQASCQKGWKNGLLNTLCRRTFMAQLPPFTHTRRYWLQELPALAKYDGETKEQIRSFVPKLATAKEKELPLLWQKAMQPLLDISHRLAFQLGGQTMMQIRNLEKRYQHIAGELDEVYAACLDLDHEQPMLYTEMGGMNLEQITHLVYPRINGTPFIVESLHTLQEEVWSTLHRVRNKEEMIGVAANRRIASIHNACSEVHRRVLTHNMRNMELSKKNRFLSRNAKQSDIGTDELSTAVNRVKSIQSHLGRFENGPMVYDSYRLSHLQTLAEESLTLLNTVRQRTNDPSINPFYVSLDGESYAEDWSGLVE